MAGCAMHGKGLNWRRATAVLAATVVVWTGGAAWAQPANDNFANAEVLAGLHGSVSNDTAQATAEPGEPSHAGFPAANTVWYRWTAPQDGEVQLDTLSSPAGVDTVLAVYVGDSLGSLRQIAANDDLPPTAYSKINGRRLVDFINPTSGLRFNARAGTNYCIVVGTKYFGGGPVVLGWAYHPAGVFRFATEDTFTTFDPETFQLISVPIFQCSEMESMSTESASTVETYYLFGVPGLLVTVTRSAGSTGRMLVDYATEDIAEPLPGDIPAMAGVDYIPAQGTLVFDHGEMTKRILIQVLPDFMVPQTNRDFAVVLSNARPDRLESPEVSQPRIDGALGRAIVRILDVDIDPVMERNFQVVGTNDPPEIVFQPTNSIFNFSRVAYRTVEDVNGYWGEVTVWVDRYGTNNESVTLHYRVDNFLGAGDDADPGELDNNYFPLQPGSDYATPTPPDEPIGIHGTNSDFYMTGNYTFPGGGTLDWGQNDFRSKAITFVVTNDPLTEFNEDFHLFLYRNDQDGHPYLVGMINETAVTILYDDQDPPAGSLDQYHNPDFGALMAPPITTTPANQAFPGADGVVYDLHVQTDDKTVIVGDFLNYNATGRRRIARINVDGSLDTSFNPGVGANDFIGALAATGSGQFILGGGFTAFNGQPRSRVARINPNGSLDGGFDPGTGPNGAVWAVAVQPDGKVLIAGEFTTVNHVPRLHVARLHGNGALDTTFDPGTNGPDATVWTLALQPDDKMLIKNDFWTVGGLVRGGVARLNADGTLDTTFNPGGGTDGSVYALTLQGDGKVLVGGAFSLMDFEPRNNLARLNSDGSVDFTFDPASIGTDGPVYTIELDGPSIYIGGSFDTYNGTRRWSIARLYSDGTLDTGWLDPAYNQFAGLYRARFSDPRGIVFAAGVQTDGKLMIGGSFEKVGGGQALAEVRPDASDPNLWVEPKSRDGLRNRLNVARLLGGSTPGPGNIGFAQPTYQANENQAFLSVTLVRTNGTLGYLSANFEVEEGLARSGTDYIYNAVPPIYLTSWEAVWPASEPLSTTRMMSDGLFGDNFIPTSIFGQQWYSYTPGFLTVTLLNDSVSQGDRNTTLRLANPTFADTFYLGGENIPLGGALGLSRVPVNIVDDDKKPGVLAFARAEFVVNEGVGSAVVTVIRTNGSSGTVSCRYATVSGGTATAGADYATRTGTLNFLNGVTNLTFSIPIVNDSSTEPDETIELRLLEPLGGGATFGPSNAVVTIVDDDTPGGKLNFSQTAFGAPEDAGQALITVTRSGSSQGSLTVYAMATNGTALHGQDFIGVTNLLTWTNGDVSPKTFTVPLLNDVVIEPHETVTLRLVSPMLNGLTNPASLGPRAAATLWITNDDLSGLVAFSTPVYRANENGGPAVITVVRANGAAESVTVNFAATAATAVAGYDFVPTNGTLSFGPGELTKSFAVQILDQPFQDPGQRFVTLTLSNATPAGALGSPATAIINIIDDESVNEPAGSLDTTFAPVGMDEGVLALALQSDGKILAGGDFTLVNYVSRQRLVRLLGEDGSVDPTFNAAANGSVRSLAVQEDGSILLAGAFTAVNGVVRNHIARLKSNGVLDTAFDPGYGTDHPVFAMAAATVGSERKIVLGGAFTLVNGFTRKGVAVLNNDGSVDAAFDPGTGANGVVYAVAVYPTNTTHAGKILVGGDFASFNGTPRPRLVRLHPNGTVDTSFNVGVGPDDAVRAIVIQPDGRVLIGGAFSSVNGVSLPRLARLHADGGVDMSFNPGQGANDTVTAFVLQGDLRIIVGGQFTRCNGVTRNRITRLNQDGTVDPTINFGLGANNFVAAALLDPNGRILIGGGFTEYDGTPRQRIARIYGGSIAGSGTFEFTAGLYEASESATNAVVTVRRRGGTSAPPGGSDVTVRTVTSDGTATNGIHYVGGTNTLVFPPGEVLVSLLLPLINDDEVNDDRTVNLLLTDLQPAGVPGLGWGNQPSALLRIVNDDSAISFSADTFTAGENSPNGVALVTLVRRGSVGAAASVDFTTTTNGTAAAGADFFHVTNTVVFAPGETTKLVTIPLVNDLLPEGDKTVTMELTNVIGAFLLSPFQATLTIVDDDFAPGQIGFAAPVYWAAENGGQAVVSLLRTNGRSGTVSVGYYTTDVTANAGLDYAAAAGGTVTFADGETNKNILIPLVNDTLVEGDELFLVTLTNATGGATLLSTTNTAPVIVLDDELGFTFSAPAYVVGEGGGSVTFTVLRVGDTNRPVSVRYATSNITATAGADYVGAQGTLNFARGETFKTVTISVLEDTQVEGDETFAVVLSEPSPGAYLLMASATAAIVDNDAGVFFGAVSYTVTEATSNGVYTNVVIEVVRTNATTGEITVGYSTASGTATAGDDFTPASGVLVFTNGEVLKTISIPIVDDTVVEDSETFTVSLFNPSGGAVLLNPSTTTVTILDNDAGIRFLQATSIVSEGGVQALVTVVRSNVLDTTVSVRYSTEDGTATSGQDYVSASGELVFTNGETAKTFAVPIVDDTLEEGTETVNLRLSAPVGQASLINPAAAVLLIVDNDGGVIVPAGSRLLTDPNSNGAIDPGERVTVRFALRNASALDTTNLVATLLATNGVTQPGAAQAYGALAAGGPSVSRDFTFTAQGTNGGFVTAMFQLQDGPMSYGHVSFTYLLGSTTVGFTNSVGITIADNSPAVPYPSVITVTGLVGVLSKATVTLTNLAHANPDDIDLLLVSPTGQKAVLMSDTGGSLQVTNITLTFDDSAANGLPDNGPLTNGTFKPTNFGTADNFPLPAPAAPYSNSLATFQGFNPNGEWKLFIVDDAPWDQGVITRGWQLAITTSGRIPAEADLSLTVQSAPTTVVVTSNVLFTLRLTNHGPWAVSGVVVTNLLPANATLLGVTASTGAFTTNGNALCWSIGNLAENGWATATVLLRADAVGTLTNTVVADAAEPDPNPANNTQVVPVVVASPTADLAVALWDTPDPVPVGGLLTYSVLVTNRGPATAERVGVTNTLPTGVALVSATPSGYTLSGNSLVYTNLGGLGSGASTALTVVVQPVNAGELTASVTVGSAVTDPLKGNNTAAVKTTVFAPQLGYSLTAGSLTLCWPVAAGNFQLEMTTNLVPPVVWLPVTSPPPELRGDQMCVTISVGSGSAFFRLRASTP